jgi:hypothetical protein
MNSPQVHSLPKAIKILTLLLISIGGVFAFFYLTFEKKAYSSIESALFLDSIVVPFDWVQIGPISFPISVDNFLIFQEFKALAPEFKTTESYFFGMIVLMISSAFLALISEFKKTYFLIATIGWIVLLTFGNFNGLNIGGLSANFPLIILLVGTLLPIIYFHIWGQSISFGIKWLISTLSFAASAGLMTEMSTIVSPVLYLAYHATVLSFGLSIAWVFWNGHAVMSGSYLLLCRVNRNIGIKISSQMMVIAGLYLILLIVLYLDLIGDQVLFFPIFNPLFLIFPIGLLGWWPLKAKINQSHGLAAGSTVLKTLYLLGFGMSLWLIWKLQISGNQPGIELLKHLLIYSQFGFSLFFMVYLFSNFFSIMNSGNAVEKILYKPHYLPYYHLRIGGLIAMLLLTTVADGIVGVQVNSMSTNILADYYYETDQKLEASILYENAWVRYRNNPKAKHTTAQLLFQLNQPSLAKQHLEESFAQAPQVDNIILLSDRLHREKKIFESIYYLERGLKYFPNEPKLVNNLALFYTKINRTNDALNLLSNSKNTDTILNSNLLALQIKNGKSEIGHKSPHSAIDQINHLAASNSLGNIPTEDLLNSLRQNLKNQDSPMILQAALRNIHSQKERSNPDADLRVLDSLAAREDMQDYIMNLQETAVIRSLGAGRVTEAIKNLNGLAFRNPSDAGYFLHLSSSILAQNLDFKKATNELIAAEEKGFQAFKPHHLAIINLGGMPEKAFELAQNYQIDFPIYLQKDNGLTSEYLSQIGAFHEKRGTDHVEKWKTLAPNVLKTDLALRILSYKAHDLERTHLNQLQDYLSSELGEQKQLEKYLQNPDFNQPESLKAYTNWLKVGEELTANPYLTPLILTAAKQTKDPVMAYQILNNASEFNQDPFLWMLKIKAARNIGLDNYANEAFLELSKKIQISELLLLQEKNF